MPHKGILTHSCHGDIVLATLMKVVNGCFLCACALSPSCSDDDDLDLALGLYQSQRGRSASHDFSTGVPPPCCRRVISF